MSKIAFALVFNFYIEGKYERYDGYGYYIKCAGIITTSFFYIFDFHDRRAQSISAFATIVVMIATVAEHFCSDRNTCSNRSDHNGNQPLHDC